MWKQFIALARGRRLEAAEAVIDRNAHAVLRQQIRDGAGALEKARLAVAVALAQESEETRRAEALERRVADLEGRALAALETGKDALAREAAEAIARLEADLAASRGAHEGFCAEIERLRRPVASARRWPRRSSRRRASLSEIGRAHV